MLGPRERNRRLLRPARMTRIEKLQSLSQELLPMCIPKRMGMRLLVKTENVSHRKDQEQKASGINLPGA